MKARNNYIQFLDEAGESGKNTKKVVEIKELLRKAEIDDEPLEKEVLILERKAIKDSEHAKWEAIREVTPFCSIHKSGGLTSEYSTGKSWHYSLRHLRRFSRYCHRFRLHLLPNMRVHHRPPR